MFIEAKNSVPSPVPRDEQVPYQNYVHAEGKAVLCLFNAASRDSMSGRPERIFWSDMMAFCCASVMRVTGGTMGGIEAIWRLSIKNKVFQSRPYTLLVQMCLVLRRPQVQYQPLTVPCYYQTTQDVVRHVVVETPGRLEFAVRDDAFFALLAADNGKGVGRMLASYPGMFGRRLMTRVRVFRRQRTPMPGLCWLLDEVRPPSPPPPPPPLGPPEPPQRPMSRKERRRHDRLASRSSVGSPGAR